MKHFGDITKISGYDVPIVDVITGGSPCQDLSVAGLRKGLAGERSGLFMEQIRIIKEMREKEKQNGKTVDDIRPRYMVWENVPGAFSSNNGEDFRAVLEETAKVTDENAVIPGLANGQKWSTSGCILADGWSIAWRLHDARFWGVPQRRKRISLVADFNGQTAPEILFERKSMSRDIAQGGAKEQGSAGAIADSIRDTSAIGLNKECYGISPFDSNAMKSPNPNSGIYKADSTKTLDVHGGNPNCNQGGICIVEKNNIENKGLYDVRISSDGTKNWRAHCYETEISRTLDTGGEDPDSNHGGICVVENPVAYGVDCYNQAQKKEETMSMRSSKVDTDHIPCVYCVDQGGGKSNGIESALSFQERGGKPGGGKGILIQDEHIGAMKTNQNQYVCGFPKGYAEIEKASPVGGDDGPKDCNFTKNYGEGKQIPYTQQSISEYKNCGVASSLMARDYKSPKDLVCFSLDRAAYNQGINAKYDFAVKEDETMTLVARGPSAICECASDYKEEQPMVTKKNEPRPIVRRLTPLECERLQGFPDGWTDIGDWIDTKGKLHKGDSDTPRYKALGNSIALPFWGWMAKRMCAYLKEPTMASLFDGIGGFPLVYSQAGCKPIWASEIEEFPIAVTKRRFGED